jgi:hypothetical protein
MSPSSEFSLFEENFYSSGYSVLVVKFDYFMNIIWSKQYSSEIAPIINSFKTSSSGALLISGLLTIDNTDLGKASKKLENFTTVFAISLNINGEIENIWDCEENIITGNDFDVDDLDNRFIVASYLDSLFIGDSAFACSDYLGPYETGVILKYNDSDEFVWAKSAYPELDIYKFIEADDAGDIYIGIQDIDYQWGAASVMKINTNSQLLWHQSNEKPWSEFPPVSSFIKSMAVDKENSEVYINIMNYGPLQYDSNQILGVGYNFLIKFNGLGEYKWNRNLGGAAGFEDVDVFYRNDSVYFSGMLADSIQLTNHYEYAESFGSAHFGALDPVDAHILAYKRSHSDCNISQQASSVVTMDSSIFVLVTTESSISCLLRFDEIESQSPGTFLCRFNFDSSSEMLDSKINPNISISPNPANELLNLYVENLTETIGEITN